MSINNLKPKGVERILVGIVIVDALGAGGSKVNAYIMQDLRVVR